jgi:non-lysosomal glucosylceramidase
LTRNVANDPSETSKRTSFEPAGAPLGGVGAGCVELGRDSRFRNITINNNRTAATRIPVAGASFLAVRAARQGRVQTRILQPDSTVPFAETGIAPPYTPPDLISWRGLYPCSHYRLMDPAFPVDIAWTGMNPIVPYDLDASTLPLFFLTIRASNKGQESVEVSTIVNWENLCGCTRGHCPEKRGAIRAVFEPRDDEEEQQAAPSILGLEFGFTKEYRSNAEGNYCLMAQQQDDAEISVMGWDERKAAELRVLWESFTSDGGLGNRLSRSPHSHSAAVCVTSELPPGSSRDFVYVLSWHCPRFEIEGVDMGNAYANRFGDATDTARRAMQHYDYYVGAVETWQKRILDSSLPSWFNESLINNNYVFSTNSLFTADGKFAMMETPEDPLMGAIDRHFHSSLGVLLFFPDLEHRELAQFAHTQDSRSGGRISQNLGRLCLHRPGNGPGRDEQLDINAKFVLLAYRDYVMTGGLSHAKHIYPQVKRAMAYLAGKDRNGDGLPEGTGVCTMYGDWAFYGANSYTTGLWLAAVRAYAKLARRMGEPGEARRYEALLANAVEQFEERLWNEQEGHYCLYHDESTDTTDHSARNEACHCGQLAGQWYADFLCLGQILQYERVCRALDTMSHRNERGHGVAIAYMSDGRPCTNPPSVPQDPQTGRSWPAFAATHYASLQIHYGRVDGGLSAVEKNCKNMHDSRDRTFNQPLSWDLDRNEACGWGGDRHFGSTSIWHVLYAVEGFLLDVPSHTLWLHPNLPKGVRSLSAPLFTPESLGWLRFEECKEGAYWQRVEISFDSPLHVLRVVLRVPKEVSDVSVECISQEGVEAVDHVVGLAGNQRLVEVIAPKPIVIGASLIIALSGKAPSAELERQTSGA